MALDNGFQSYDGDQEHVANGVRLNELKTFEYIS